MVAEHVVVIEHEGDARGAYVPDLPDCVAAGRSHDEVGKLAAEAIPPAHPVLAGAWRAGSPCDGDGLNEGPGRVSTADPACPLT